MASGRATGDPLSDLKAVLANLRLHAHGGCAVLSGLGRPFGLAHDAAGQLYVTDMDLHAVFRLTADLRFAQVLADGRSGWSAWHSVPSGTASAAKPLAPGMFNGPHCVEPAIGGELLVTTYYQPGIHVVDAEGQCVRVLGTSREQCLLDGPAAALFDNSGRLLVAEYRQHSVLALTDSGDLLGRLGAGALGQPLQFTHDGPAKASSAAGGFDRPHMCRQAPDGSLVVVDTWNHRLQRFTADGRWLGWLGAQAGGSELHSWSDHAGTSRTGEKPGALHAPVAIDFRDDGIAAVTDWGNHRIQFFDVAGRSLGIAAGLQLKSPYDARFWGDRLAIADSHHGRVCIVPARL